MINNIQGMKSAIQISLGLCIYDSMKLLSKELLVSHVPLVSQRSYKYVGA